ncbi:MAG TPA: hypothetical protein P5572_22430, partial [Phycisphaerae bacterium]|nr:hypothetical protein [Phycisphaerae bacterium]
REDGVLDRVDAFADFGDALPARVFYAFKRPLENEQSIVISIEDLGGRIGPERLSAKDLRAAGVDPTGINLEYWPLQRMHVNVIIAHHPLGDMDVMTLGAQLPLTARGIQVTVAAPQAYEAEARSLLEGILGSFDGELIAGQLPDGQYFTMRRMPTGERIVTLAWSITGIVGWVALLSYAVLRLALISRADRLLRMRKHWLAIAGLGIFLGGVGRAIASITFHKADVVTAIINVAIGLLVINAHLRLARRVKAEAVAAPAPEDAEPLPVEAGTSSGDV